MMKVLGMGNALVDYLFKLESDELLQMLNLPKGSMQLVDEDTSKAIREKAGRLPKQVASGGSAANTINGIAYLGGECGYIGKIGQDEVGQIFKKDLENRNIQAKLHISHQSPSGVASAFISPDAERTFATFLGAAVELSADDMTEAEFEGYRFFHLEGYLALNHKLIEESVAIAKKKGLKVSIDMASFNVVEDNLDFLKKVVKESVDIVFANEEEAKAFTGKEPEGALHEIATMCDIAVVKVGSKGSYIQSGDEVIKIEPIEAVSIDSTGAGDLYAAGFLYGLSQGYGLKKCGDIGSVLAGNVIQEVGARMSEERWEKVKGLVSKL